MTKRFSKNLFLYWYSEHSDDELVKDIGAQI